MEKMPEEFREKNSAEAAPSQVKTGNQSIVSQDIWDLGCENYELKTTLFCIRAISAILISGIQTLKEMPCKKWYCLFSDV